MQLGVRDVARLFEVAEKTVYRWVQEDELPAYEVDGQHRFHRAEVLEWATARDLTPSFEIFEEDASAPETSIAGALLRGGVHYAVPGTDRDGALRAIVQLLPIDERDRALVHDVLSARAGLGKTGVGAGVAMPHVRHPIALDVSEPRLGVYFLEQPIDFAGGAAAQEPAFTAQVAGALPDPALASIHTAFFLITPSVRTHLAMLSRLAFVLHDAELGEALARRAPREDIIAAIARIEVKLRASGAGVSTTVA